MSDHLFRGAAYHEAGHIVVARHVGARVGAAWINDEKNDPGQGGCDLDASGVSVLEHVAICWAGIAAQEDFGARTFDSAGDCDLRRARSLLNHVPNDEADKAMNEAKILAKNILAALAGEVHRLAATLIEKKRLSAEEIDILLSP